MLAVLNLKIDKKQHSKSHDMRKPAFLYVKTKVQISYSAPLLLLNRLNNPFVSSLQHCTVISSSKGKDHSPESHYKSIVTFKMLKGS